MTLYRHSNAIMNLGDAGDGTDVANVLWRVQTNRTGYERLWLEFSYAIQEVDGLDTARLALWQAPSPTGPWTRAISQTNQSWRRRIVADIRPLDGPTCFAIIEESPERVLASQIVEHLLGLRPTDPSSDPSYDTNADTRIDVADIATLLAPTAR